MDNIEEIDKFLQILKRNYSYKIRKHFPDLLLFQSLIQQNKEKEMAKVFLVKYKDKIIGGSFNSFVGLIEEVNQEKGKLRVVINFFDRAIPVELDLAQVEKI